MEYLVLWGKYLYTGHPVAIYEQKKEVQIGNSQVYLYQFIACCTFWLLCQNTLCYKINALKLWITVHIVVRKFSYLLRIVCRCFIVLSVDTPTAQNADILWWDLFTEFANAKTKHTTVCAVQSVASVIHHCMCCAVSGKCHHLLQMSQTFNFYCNRNLTYIFQFNILFKHFPPCNNQDGISI
jgi:hypothetical protein